MNAPRLAVVLLAVGLRLPHLAGRSLWYDEASSWQTARFPLSGLFESIRLNVHMPLYYVVLKVWMGVFGESVVSLRGFSVTFGVLTVLLMERVARDVYRASALQVPSDRDDTRARGFGLVVAMLVAASPYQVYASIEARMYTLGTALTALSTWLLARRVLGRGHGREWVYYGLVCAALLYTHHYGLFTVAAQFVFLGFRGAWLLGFGRRDEARSTLAPAVAVGLFVALLYLPGFGLLQGQVGRVRQDYWIRPLSWSTFSHTFSEFLVPAVGEVPPAGGWVMVAVAFLASAVLAWRGRAGDWLVLASCIVPMILSAAVSTATPVWVARYFRFAHLFFLTSLALAAWRLTRTVPGLRGPLVGVAVAGLLTGNVVFWRSLDIPHSPGVHGAVEAVLAGSREGETVVALDMYQYFPAKYYLGSRATARLLSPGLEQFWGGHLIRPSDLIAPEDLGGALSRGVWTIGREADPAALIPELAGTSTGPAQVFVYYDYLHKRVYLHHFAAPAPNLEAGRAAVSLPGSVEPPRVRSLP